MIFLRKKHTEIETPTGRVGMSGQYKLIVRHHDGTVKRETPWFDNIITDAGLNQLGLSSASTSGCAIGTGTAVPLASNTSLQVLGAYTTQGGPGSLAETAQTSAPYFLTITTVYRFAVGQLAGNYSEVGVGWTSTNMFSRALIVDAVGAPTTITVGSTEQLDVVYQLRSYFPTADASTSIVISGVTYAITGRAAEVTSTSYGITGIRAGYVSYPYDAGTAAAAFSGSIGSITGAPSGNSARAASTGVESSYSNNSFEKSSTVSWGLTEGNLPSAAPIKSVLFRSYALGGMCPQYEFTPGILKDNTKTLSLTYKIGWGRRP